MSFLLFILGAILVSGMNCLIYRRNRKLSWITGRSFCDFCHSELDLVSLIPILNYYLLNGRSKCCGHPLSIYDPITEALGGFCLVLLFYTFGLSTEFLYYGLIFLGFMFLALQDLWDYSVYFLDIIILSCIIILLSILFHRFLNIYPSLFFIGLYTLIYWLSKGSIGVGDIWVSAVLGLLHRSIWSAFISFTLSFSLGAIVGVVILLKKEGDLKTKLPLVPFLVFGSLIHLII